MRSAYILCTPICACSMLCIMGDCLAISLNLFSLSLLCLFIVGATSCKYYQYFDTNTSLLFVFQRLSHCQQVAINLVAWRWGNICSDNCRTRSAAAEFHWLFYRLCKTTIHRVQCIVNVIINAVSSHTKSIMLIIIFFFLFFTEVKLFYFTIWHVYNWAQKVNFHRIQHYQM